MTVCIIGPHTRPMYTICICICICMILSFGPFCGIKTCADQTCKKLSTAKQCDHCILRHKVPMYNSDSSEYAKASKYNRAKYVKFFT